MSSLLSRATSKKMAIKDWHLMLLVFGASLVTGLILLVYIIYEGVTTGYDATVEINVERPFSVDGVRKWEGQVGIVVKSRGHWQIQSYY